MIENSNDFQMFVLVHLLFLLLYPYHSVSVANLKYFETLTHVAVTSSIKRAADGSRHLAKHLMFRAFERQFDLTVTPGSHLMAKGFQAHLINGDGKPRQFHFHNQIFSGHLSDRPDVRVHVHREEALWAAQIFDHDNIYMLEPAWRLLKPAENPKNDTLIAYRSSDMTSNSFNSSHFCDAKTYEESHTHKPRRARHRLIRLRKQEVYSFPSRQAGKNTTREKRTRTDRVCMLYLVGDYTFYKGKCNGNHVACTALMFASVNFVDHIYATSPFVDSNNQIHTGIGMQIKEIIIYRTFSTSLKTMNYTHFNADISWTANARLVSFAYYISYLTFEKPRFCAHHLFTDYPYPKHILGIAWLDALCYHEFVYEKKTPGFVKQNCALSTGTDFLGGGFPTLQMNLVIAHGHIFGSEHDLANNECSHTEQYGGNFIMWSKSVTGKYYNNLKFSPCSLRHIGLQLQYVNCLVPRTEQFCGNGALDDNEHCDAGTSGMTNKDQCCDKLCKLRPNATCSDANHLCCKKCQLAPANTLCFGGEPAECSQPSYCTGRDYFCPDPAPVADGTPCPDFGKCFNGKCMSFCSIQSTIKNVRLQGCMCQTNDDGAACRLCCFNVESNSTLEICQPFSTKSLKDGTPCYMGVCMNGVCESREVTTIQRIYRFLPHIRKSELTKFMMDHLVLSVVVLSLIIWMPPSIIFYRIDNTSKQRLAAVGGRRISLVRNIPDEKIDIGDVDSHVTHGDQPDSVIADTESVLLTDSLVSFFSEVEKKFTGRTQEGSAVRFESEVLDKEPGGEMDSAKFDGSDKEGSSVRGKNEEGKVRSPVVARDPNDRKKEARSDKT